MTDQRKKVDVAVYQKAKKGQYYCGDSYFYTETENEFVCVLADGLGSGEFAMESSRIVTEIIRSNIHTTVEQLIKRCNEQLSGKRGVVIGILKMDFLSKRYSFSSIGNIGVLTIPKSGKKKRNIPNAGYLAGYHRSFKVVTDKLDAEMNFIMFSDGVSDTDLSKGMFLNTDVHQIVIDYENIVGGSRYDDTTLIAIRYDE
ncbi:protein phosphatase 2C domain-containing protein [Virgibacillus ihumii]|uniref:protein phosphatase 2C domain-containing protein n=1 Tax=Virgibacillus ihumii TaxID=2686091 RepID=UPI001FE395B7|nr:protein phosphatase 2C domain-containing protein [Virgibacillus ihumii]